VRHTYGDRRAWELPGGGVKRGESPLDAVRREAREEVGADLADWREVAAVTGTWHGRRDTVWVFAAAWPGGPPDVDDLELADFAWFSPGTLPDRLSPATRAAMAVLPPAGG
jgi:8-oxo-dGTP pyrophosphatase MutT (NUDIX family)